MHNTTCIQNSNIFEIWSGYWVKNTWEGEGQTTSKADSAVDYIQKSNNRRLNNIYIDIKGICNKKSKSEMLEIIKLELHQADWAKDEINELDLMFKRFKVREEAQKNPYLQSKEYESQ